MPRLKAEVSVWVTVDGRKFRVDYDEVLDAIRIIERKQAKSDKAWLRHLYNAPYWHRDHHGLGVPSTIPQRVLSEAWRALKV